MEQKARVYVIDDDAAMRDSLEFLLDSSGFDVTLFESAQHFLDALPGLAFGCIVSDVRMPGIDGIELLKHMKAAGSRFPILIMTGHGDVPLAVDAMRHGAANFIEKPFDAPLLIDAIHTALANHAPQAASPALATLTRRERQVLDGIMSGKLNKVIADELNISPKTVELHRANMMAKLGAHNVVELTRVVLGQN